jgi:hypothetical protein
MNTPSFADPKSLHKDVIEEQFSAPACTGKPRSTIDPNAQELGSGSEHFLPTDASASTRTFSGRLAEGLL